MSGQWSKHGFVCKGVQPPLSYSVTYQAQAVMKAADVAMYKLLNTLYACLRVFCSAGDRALKNLAKGGTNSLSLTTLTTKTASEISNTSKRSTGSPSRGGISCRSMWDRVSAMSAGLPGGRAARAV